MKRKTAVYPAKRSMNLYYKPDRTTKPATCALYALFVLVCLLGLSKFLVYDLYMEAEAAERALASAEEELTAAMLELSDYSEVQERYLRYTANSEERALVDRMEVLALLDEAVRSAAKMELISISGDTVRLQFRDVTLARAARIVRALEESPIVADTTVNTAITPEKSSPGVSAPVQTNMLIHLQKEAEE